jgi:hypothetical protein
MALILKSVYILKHYLCELIPPQESHLYTKTITISNEGDLKMQLIKVGENDNSLQLTLVDRKRNVVIHLRNNNNKIMLRQISHLSKYKAGIRLPFPPHIHKLEQFHMRCKEVDHLRCPHHREEVGY